MLSREGTNGVHLEEEEPDNRIRNQVRCHWNRLLLSGRMTSVKKLKMKTVCLLLSTNSATMKELLKNWFNCYAEMTMLNAS